MRIQFSNSKRTRTAYTASHQKMRADQLLHESNSENAEISNDISFATLEK